MLFGRRHRRNPFKKRRHHRNPKRRFHRNPMSSFTSFVPMILAGAAGAVAVKWLPRFVGIGVKGLPYYGVQLAAIIGGGYAADKFVSKSVSDGWVVGSSAVLVTDLLSGVLSSVGLAGFGELEAFPTMSALPEETGYSMDGFGAYHDAYTYGY